jgi:hypothetical protein
MDARGNASPTAPNKAITSSLKRRVSAFPHQNEVEKVFVSGKIK